MGELIARIVEIAWDAVDTALKSRKPFKEALADSFEDAAKNIRSGKLNIDAAVEKAKKDQSTIDSARDKFQ